MSGGTTDGNCGALYLAGGGGRGGGRTGGLGGAGGRGGSLLLGLLGGFGGSVTKSSQEQVSSGS
jgi:hypothetical protein